MLKLYKGLIPYTLKIIIMLVLLFGQVMSMLFLPNMMSNIVNIGIIQNNGDIPYILSTGAIMLGIALFGSACAIAVGWFSSKVAVGFARDTRAKLFDKVEEFTLQEFDKLGTASLVTRATNDISQIQDFTVMLLRFVFMAAIMCVGGIFMAVGKNARLSLILVAVVPVVLIFIISLFRKVIPIFKATQVKLDKLNQVMRENLTGVRVIRAFNADKREQARFKEANADLTNTSIKSQVMLATMMPLLMLFINIANVFVVWFGGHLAGEGLMQVGDIMAFIQYLMQIMMSLVMMSVIFVMMPRASVCANRINEVIDTPVSITNKENAVSPQTLSGVVEFRNVSFKYDGGESNALTDINFTANPGEFTAIMGGTGSGKSSIIQLVPRLYDATEGSVFVDGVDVRDYKIEDLRRRIGYCPQKAMLFSGTIASNIAFGKKQATQKEIDDAADISQSIDFISKKEKGFEDGIAQGGSNVSGGQKQRLAIARAMCSDASIYIFDDSFSALDFKTDAALRKAIREKTKNATVIIVAQRINTVMNADKIILINEGKIIGTGKHDELIASCDEYAQIARSQLA